MNLRASILLSIFAFCGVFAAPPPQSIDLDMSANTRAFKLAWAEGTTPLIRCNMKNAGAAYTVTGWTGTLYMQATWEDTSIQAVPSTATSGSTIDFQLTANMTATSGLFFANFVMTDGTSTVEWQRGTVDVRDSPGTDGAGTLTLTTALNWGDYTYSNTGTEGPYRAGANVTFSSNADGSQNIIATDTDTLAGLTPTAGRMIYGNGSAWTTLSPGTVGQVLAMGASLPAWASAGAGDITGVTAGAGLTGGGTSGDVTLTIPTQAVDTDSHAPATVTVDARGIVTAIATTSSAAIQTALGSVYLPLTGGTVTGDLDIQYAAPLFSVTSSDASNPASVVLSRGYDATYPNIYSKIQTVEGSSGNTLSELRTTQTSGSASRFAIYVQDAAMTTAEVIRVDPTAILFNANLTAADITSPAGTITASIGGFVGPGTGLTSLTASVLSGNIPAASFGALFLEFPGSGFAIATSAQVGYNQYTLTSGSPANAICIPTAAKSANTSEQAFIWRSSPQRIPRGWVAIATTNALSFEWIADSTTVADIRGIRVVRYVGSTATQMYSDTTTRNVGTINTVATVNIDDSAFTSTAFAPDDTVVIEVTGAIEDSMTMGLLRVSLSSE